MFDTTSRKFRILVVDDERRMVGFIRLNLEQDGFEVIEAFNGSEALDRLRDSLPDLILLDVMMPEINGFDVAAVLKNDPATKHIPIIYLTGLVTKEEFAGVEKMGSSFVVAKPVGHSELLEVVNKALADSN